MLKTATRLRRASMHIQTTVTLHAVKGSTGGRQRGLMMGRHAGRVGQRQVPGYRTQRCRQQVVLHGDVTERVAQ